MSIIFWLKAPPTRIKRYFPCKGTRPPEISVGPRGYIPSARIIQTSGFPILDPDFDLEKPEE